ncbi:MAG: hypothetical protein MH252_06210 [Thermosynechococcaceae cyanobacterium MS004]|nr:hypothetical protein [Thermosynechococcaceae cyanobacterium MS004]
MQYGQEIRDRVKQWTDIAVSIGIAPTKTLAKVANRVSKKSGRSVCHLAQLNVEEILGAMDIEDVWGIGQEGTIRGLTLSLLLDLSLLLHPRQLACVENKLPAFTVGNLQRTIQIEALLFYIEQLLQSTNPAEQLTRLSQPVQEFFFLRPSGKHMIGRDLGRLEPTPALRHRAAA